jgi:hypothetical protein
MTSLNRNKIVNNLLVKAEQDAELTAPYGNAR